MSSIAVIALGAALFLGESFARYWVIAKTWEIGRAVAWGIDDGIRLSVRERQYRLWNQQTYFMAYLFLVPLAMATALFAMASEVAGANARYVLYLFVGLELASALGALIAGPYSIVLLARNVAAGKFGYLGEEPPPAG